MASLVRRSTGSFILKSCSSVSLEYVVGSWVLVGNVVSRVWMVVLEVIVFLSLVVLVSCGFGERSEYMMEDLHRSYSLVYEEIGSCPIELV